MVVGYLNQGHSGRIIFFLFQLFSDLCCLRGILTPRQAGLLVGVTQCLRFGVKKIKNVPCTLISPTNQCCCWCRPHIPSLYRASFVHDNGKIQKSVSDSILGQTDLFSGSSGKMQKLGDNPQFSQRSRVMKVLCKLLNFDLSGLQPLAAFAPFY